MNRDRVCDIARDELGKTDPEPYWRDVLEWRCGAYPKHWCGAFVLWCYRQAGITAWKWRVGSGFAYHLPQTLNPKPGDLAYIHEPYQHHALVEFVDGNTITTIDGNSMGTVQRRVRPREKFTAFYSIASLVPPDVPVVNQ